MYQYWAYVQTLKVTHQEFFVLKFRNYTQIYNLINLFTLQLILHPVLQIYYLFNAQRFIKEINYFSQYWRVTLFKKLSHDDTVWDLYIISGRPLLTWPALLWHRLLDSPHPRVKFSISEMSEHGWKRNTEKEMLNMPGRSFVCLLLMDREP